MNDDEIKHSIEQTIIAERMRDGNKASLRECSKRLAEDTEIKERLREFLPFIKSKIEEINAMNEEDLVEIQDLETTSIPAENEYEELENNFKTVLEDDSVLKDYIKALMIYGSYAINKQVMGQSDINFILVLDNKITDLDLDINEHLDDLIELIMNPLFIHLFDLIVLFEHDIENIDNIGPAFGSIHALSAQKGKTLLGENMFKNYKFNKESVKKGAISIIKDTTEEFNQIYSKTAELELEDKAYLSAEAVVDLSLALIYTNMGTYENITKPDVVENFEKYVPKEFHEYKDLVSDAWGFKIDISLKYPESEFILKSKAYCDKIMSFLSK